MPVRQGRDKKVLGGPQGEDAFVVVRRMTVNERDSFGKLFDTRNVEDVAARETQVREETSNYILDWNWVDDNGDPLPKPHKNVEIIGLLLDDELKWIYKALLGDTEDEKKDLMPTPKRS